MRKMMKGWTGKRLTVDLSLHRTWIEEIPTDELESYLGGRGLNAKFFLEKIEPSIPSSLDESPLAFSIGPLAGTFAPCSGWTSISTLSPYADPPRYAQVSLPGHWGPQLKFAGFDQLIVQGKAEKPTYLAIDGEKVRFEDARHLWGKDTSETTVRIHEGKEGRNAEILCIGPAGENGVSFANVTNRFSWTGDHIGLGYVLGSKHLKAIVLHGNKPVALGHSDRFLELSRTLRERIYRDLNASALKEKGTFFFLGQNGGGLGMKNYNESSHPDLEDSWGTAYLKQYLSGREGCFPCPIHCGRITQVNESYFGSVHLESAWSLGRRIGIFDWEKTLRLHRLCQLQGLDPTSLESLLSWMMDGYERGVLSSQELGPLECRWGDEKAALQVIERMAGGKKTEEVLRHGSLRAAKALGKGMDAVPHFSGLDLPARDPRSSMEYALSRALFPVEWDYLQSLIQSTEAQTVLVKPQVTEQNGLLEKVSALEKLKILADMNSLCPLVVARVPLISAADIGNLISAATGTTEDVQTLQTKVRHTIMAEKVLLKIRPTGEEERDPFPSRFFNGPLEKTHLEKEMTNYDPFKEPYFSSKEDTIP